MQNHYQQKVFPFLENDPVYRRKVREQRIASQVTESLMPVLREEIVEIISEIAQTTFQEQLEKLIADAVKSATRNATTDFYSELQSAKLLIMELFSQQIERLDPSDPADWWKKNVKSDEDDEDIPF